MGSSNQKRLIGRPKATIAQLFDDGRAIDEALRLGVEDAMRRHKLLGQRVATWKGGRAVILEPDEIPIAAAAAPARRRAQKRRGSRRAG